MLAEKFVGCADQHFKESREEAAMLADFHKTAKGIAMLNLMYSAQYLAGDCKILAAALKAGEHGKAKVIMERILNDATALEMGIKNAKDLKDEN